MNQGYGYRSDIRLRKENQDTFGVFEFDDYVLLVVCDGMGGHVGGAQASAIAVRTLHDAMRDPVDTDLRTSLRRAVEAANRTIYETARKNYRLAGMGTTCVVALIEDGVAHIAHVGDSRAYMLRGTDLRQVTRDHTMVNLFVDAELLSPEDAATHPEAHVLSRSLGVERHVEVDVAPPLDLKPGDRILLTSDGVHGFIGGQALAALDWSNPKRGADEAAAAVERANGDDNATIVAWAWACQGPTAPPTPPPDLAAIAEASGTSGEPMVQTIGGTPSNEGSPAEDVAPIEEFDDIAEAFAPRIGPHARTRERASADQAQSNRRAAVALAGLAVVGFMVALVMFRGDDRKPTPRRDVAAANPAATALAVPADPALMGSAAEGLAVAQAPAVPAWVGHLDDAPLLDRHLPVAEVVPPDDQLLCIDIIKCEMRNDHGFGWKPDGLDFDWVPPPRCLDCTRSLSRPSSLAYVGLSGRERVTGIFYAPAIPEFPPRTPRTATRYAETAPRGPAQATAIRHARAKECRLTMDTVDAAMDRSIDHAVLYRTAWLCFTEAHQAPLAESSVATFQEFQKLAPHFQGILASTASTDRPAGSYRWTWSEPAQDGVEYRLQRYQADIDLRGFQDVMLDMMGEPSVADHLGTDLLLEATAAAAASRSDEQTDPLIDMWARRVYVATRAMNGSVGELVRHERPDLSDLIDALMFEATGGDAGAAAMANGVPNTFIPAEVAKAQAMALGLSAPRLAAREGGPPETLASAPRRTSPSRPRPPRPAAVAQPSTVEPTPAPTGDPMTIKVYRSVKPGPR